MEAMEVGYGREASAQSLPTHHQHVVSLIETRPFPKESGPEDASCASATVVSLFGRWCVFFFFERAVTCGHLEKFVVRPLHLLGSCCIEKEKTTSKVPTMTLLLTEGM